MKDDNDRIREGSLPNDPFADAVPVPQSGQASNSDAINPVAAHDDDYAPFPVEVLPEPARDFVREAATAIGCDSAYVALPLLAGLAAAIGNARRIQLKIGWVEPSVLWPVVVGGSGTHKSPAFDAALAPLKLLQAEGIDQYRKQKEEYDRLVEERRESRRGGRGGVGDVSALPVEPPVPWRIMVSDITVEGLAARLQQAQNGLLLARDELSGWVASFDQYRGGRGGDVAHWLEMHRAGYLLIDRKSNSETIYVPRASVSITGGIQPKTLSRVLGDQHIDNGLVARLLLAMPPRNQKRWTEDEISEETSAKLTLLYARLLDLKPDYTVDAGGAPIDLPLTAGGKAVWIEFVDQQGREQMELEGSLVAAWSKLEGYAARLALIFHLVRSVENDITLESKNAVDAQSVEAAVALTRWFGREAQRVYAALGISGPEAPTGGLMGVIRQHGGRISVRQLMQSGRRYRDKALTARAALDDLVQAEVGRWVVPTPGQPGRPGEIFELYPEGEAGGGNKTPPRQGSSGDESGTGNTGNGNKTPP